MTAVASADPQRGCGTGMVLMCAPTLHTAPPHWAYSAYSRQYVLSLYIYTVYCIYIHSVENKGSAKLALMHPV